MNDNSAGQGPLKRPVRPELPPASLLVECAQSWVHGWTESEVRDYGERCAELRTRELRGALQELRIRLHAQGRRPEECYEMSLIDSALMV
jgi:hypothetical protein